MIRRRFLILTISLTLLLSILPWSNAGAAKPGTTNLGLDSGFSLQLLDGNLVAFGVRESNQDGTDLNGDNDTSDLVLHVATLGK